MLRKQSEPPVERLLSYFLLLIPYFFWVVTIVIVFLLPLKQGQVKRRGA